MIGLQIRWGVIAPIFAAIVILSGCHRPPLPASSAAVRSAVPPPLKLVEVASERGIRFQHSHGSNFPLTIVEALGSGCALFDFDGDGRLDVFLVSAGQDFRKAVQEPGSRLYRNTGPGFEDVTSQSGIHIDGYAMGCCAGDYDSDGRTDLFVTGFGRNWLYRNLGSGRFMDVTNSAGILRRAKAWGMGCAFLDFNRDGRLDLYVANYVKYDSGMPLCETGGVKHGCTPNQYATQPNELYVNQGNGKFVEKAAALGAEDKSGAGLGVVVCDFDNDGWPDIFVANDGTPNALLHNEQGRFRDLAQPSGVAYSEDGAMRAGMGTDAGDIDGDGLFDLTITNFQHEPNALYRNAGKMLFEEVTYPSGIGTPTLNRLAFGTTFADLDRDGLQDLYVGNGHVFDNVRLFDDTATYEQVDQVFRGLQDGRFEEVQPSSGAFPTTASVTRSLACGDFNNDGAIDLLINSLGKPARLLENRTAPRGSWIGLKLQGRNSNRDAIGARVELRDNGRLQVREVRSGGSYLGQSDFRVLFNLLSDSPAGLKLRIRWPDGRFQDLKTPALNRYVTVVEPK